MFSLPSVSNSVPTVVVAVSFSGDLVGDSSVFSPSPSLSVLFILPSVSAGVLSRTNLSYLITTVVVPVLFSNDLVGEGRAFAPTPSTVVFDS